jgi:hypothetical protein
MPTQGCQENPRTPMSQQVWGRCASHGLMAHNPFNGAFEEILHLYLAEN